jgi:hypothetical protein
MMTSFLDIKIIFNCLLHGAWLRQYPPTQTESFKPKNTNPNFTENFLTCGLYKKVK